MPNGTTISDVRPNTFGPLQPIRPPGGGVALPSPLNTQAFFQSQNVLLGKQRLAHDKRRLDQLDVSMDLQKKQVDLRERELIFRQSQDFLNRSDAAFDNFYVENVNQRKQQGSAPGSVGLDTRFKKHAELQTQFNDRLNELQSGVNTTFSDMSKSGKLDEGARASLIHEMNTGISTLKREMTSNPEYRKYAVQHFNYNAWLDRLAQDRAAGKNVDERKVSEIQAKYERFANGSLKPADQISISDFQPYTFDGKQAYADIDAMAKNIYTPTISAEAVEFEETPGVVMQGRRSTSMSEEEATPLLVQQALGNDNIVRTFTSLTGIDPRTSKEGMAQFANWVRLQSSEYAPIKGQESVLSTVDRTLVDPNVTTRRSSRTSTGVGNAGAPLGNGLFVGPDGNPSLFSGTTDRVKDAQSAEADIRRRGYDPLSGYGKEALGPADIIEGISKAGRKRTIVDPETGELVVYQQILEDGIVAEEIELGRFKKPPAPESRPIPAGVSEVNLKRSGRPDPGFRNNNPSNVRPTGSQMSGAVPMNDGTGRLELSDGRIAVPDEAEPGQYFIQGRDFEEGLEIGRQDIQTKIDGGSDAMKAKTVRNVRTGKQVTSYMGDKYGDRNLDNYEDFATVQDLIEVRTPREKYGGDNIDKNVDGLIEAVEAVVPRDTKLKDLTPEQVVDMYEKIVAHESPDSGKFLRNRKEAIKTLADRFDVINENDKLQNVTKVDDDSYRIDYVDSTGARQALTTIDQDLANEVADQLGINIREESTAPVATTTPTTPAKTEAQKRLDEVYSRFGIGKGDKSFEELYLTEITGTIDFENGPLTPESVAEYVLDNKIKTSESIDLPNSINIKSKGRNKEVDSLPFSKLTSELKNTEKELDKARKEKDRIDSHVRELNLRRERNSIKEGTDFIPVSADDDLFDVLLPGEKSPFKKMDSVNDLVVSLEEKLDTLQRGLASPEIHASIVEHMIPEYADASYDALAEQIVDQLRISDGDPIELDDGNIIVRASRGNSPNNDNPDDKFFISKNGQLTTVTLDDLDEYVAKNLKAEAFALFSPQEVFRAEVEALENQVATQPLPNEEVNGFLTL